ncbi:MAG: DNA-directed RNA polymerase subunit H [Thermoplasmatota archaeon]
MGSFNVMKHGLVPEHRLLDKDKEDEVLQYIGIKKEQLPKILKSDPVIQHMEKSYGDIEEGRIAEIKRQSSTAGIAKAYRLVINK